MVRYRCIGYGTTDGNGVATLNYTGQGVGEVDFVASAESPSEINSSSDVSQPYNVLDCIFKDMGISSDYGIWTSTDFTGTKISRGDDYTTLTPEDTWDTQDKSISNDNLCVEFDVNFTYSTSFYFLRFYGNGNSIVGITQSDLGLTSGSWSHIKLVRNGNTITPIVDSVEKTPKSVSASLDNFRIMLDNSKCTNMKYKNFCIYPI